MPPKKGQIVLNTWEGGLATTPGPMVLQPNQFPGGQNFIPMVGRTRYRGGTTSLCNLTAAADDLYQFYDSVGNRHLAVWAGGNLYDCVSGIPVLIAANVSSIGKSVAHATLNGILYWSPPPTSFNQLQFWNPVTQTLGNVPTGAGGILPPPCTWLVNYNGSLVALNPYINGAQQMGSFIVANVNDPTTWLALNVTTPGGHDSSYLSFAVNLGISGDGILSSQGFLVGRSGRDIYAYSGPATTLTQLQISCPVGCLDGHSAIYIPNQETNTGIVVFLGTDYQFWMTSGQESTPISTANVLEYCYNAVTQAIQQTPVLNGLSLNQPLPPNITLFSAAYNPEYAYYMCDLGQNNQIGYRWQTNAFFGLQDWPSGPYINASSSAGYPTILVGGRNSTPASNVLIWDVGKWDQQLWAGNSYSIYQVAIDGASDAGNIPSIFWQSPWLHAGNFNMEKLWEWLDLVFVDNNTSYTVTVAAWPRWDGYQATSPTYTLQLPNPYANSNAFVWDQSLWDQAFWQQVSYFNLNTPTYQKIRLGALVPPSTAKLYAASQAELPLENMASGAIQLTISYNGGNLAFDLLSIAARFTELTGMRGGNIGYNPEAEPNLPGIVAATPEVLP